MNTIVRHFRLNIVTFRRTPAAGTRTRLQMSIAQPSRDRSLCVTSED